MTIEQSERTVTRGDAFIHVREMRDSAAAAEAVPVLLLHSGGFTSRQWRRLAEALAPTHPVLLPDFLGYGKSSKWPDGTSFSFREDLAMVETLADEIGRPLHVVGHSYGGLLGLLLALDRPAQVRSIAVYEPVCFGFVDERIDAEGDLAQMQVKTKAEAASGKVSDGWLETFVDWWNGPGAWKGMNDETRGAFRQVSWKLLQEVQSLSADDTSLATYATITAPTLLLTGEKSPGVERRVVEALAGALPRATLQRFAGAGHMAPITHAGAVNEAIVEHLAANDSPL
jgi:pimeloyl-ACP methyl ester carboxylesterase